MRLLIKYRDDQPRLPAGAFGGGRWTAEGSSIPLRGSNPQMRDGGTRIAQLPERARLVQQIKYSNRRLCVYDTSIGQLIGEGSLFGCVERPFMTELFHYRLLNDNKP